MQILHYVRSHPEHRMQALSDAWGQIALLVQMFLGLIAGPAQQTPPPPTISVNVFDYQHRSAAATSFNPHQHHHQQAATASNSSASSSTSRGQFRRRHSRQLHDLRRQTLPLTQTRTVHPHVPSIPLRTSRLPTFLSTPGIL